MISLRRLTASFVVATSALAFPSVFAQTEAESVFPIVGVREKIYSCNEDAARFFITRRHGLQDVKVRVVNAETGVLVAGGRLPASEGETLTLTANESIGDLQGKYYAIRLLSTTNPQDVVQVAYIYVYHFDDC